ncbi:MAG: hypothetical protein KDC53_23590, partial [Saprospiraceae bacterium]|nr:hypothetical protein [Saprospiraceae bacterium]
MNHSLHPTLSMLRLYVAVVCVCTYLGGVAQSDLFISEYLEDGATKCIEIFNPTNTSITLTGSYRLRIGYNGAAPQTLRNLTGSIGPKQTIVACSSGSAYANFQVFTAGPNGNDVVLLEKDMSPIDIVGNIGCDPGAEWSSAGLSTQGMSLVRKGCINDGIGSDPPDPPCDFPTLATEWLGYTAGTSRLGSHDYLYGAISSTTVSPSFCGATDGSIEIIADGNGLEFSINGQAGPFTPTNSFSGLVAGTYDIYVRIAEDHSCFIQGEATLDEGPPIAIEDVHIQSPSDCGINDGMIEIVVNGDNLEYSIDDGATYQSDPIFTNLAPAIYEIAVRTITNSSCTTFGVVTLSAPIIPMIHSVSTTPVSDCAAVDGVALINATPFNLEYSIDNGQTWSLNSEFRNLTSGIYMVIVRNNSAPSCRDSKTITIDSPDYPEITLSDILHVDCKGKSNGSITTLTSGGSGSYHYTWSGPTAIGNTPSPIDLSAGDYSVTISDAAFNQCQDTIENIVITEPSTDPIRPQLTSLADVCELDEPIALNKTQDGITGSWSGPGVASNFFDPGGLNGMITLTFTPEEQWCASEANRSLSVMKAQIPGLMPISNLCITDDPVDLDDVQDGISGQWSGPGVVGNQFFPNGLDGKISLSFVVNAGQCAIDNDLAITVYALANPVLDPLPQLCENNPVIPLPTFQDGILGEWSGVGVQDNTFDPEGLSGTFNLTFQPLSSQCASQAAQPIVVGSSPVLSVTKNNPTCFGKANGSIVLSVSEGTVPYVIDWDIDGLGEYDDEENLSNLPAGRYIVSIKDQSNCIVSDTINLKHPEELSVIAEGKDESQKGAKDGEINLKVTGGSGPYTYLWSTGSTMSDLKNLANGSYSVTVTDRYDCISTTQVTIDFLSCTIPIQIVKTDLSCPQSNDGSIQVIANNAQEPVHYQWSKSNAPDTNQLQELEAGTYTLTVQDAQGCITNE